MSYTPIYVSIVMYGLRLFIVVLQELHCLHKCNLSYSMVVISISTQSFVSELCTVIEIETEEEQQQGEDKEL